jgi:hypothetical protein
LVTGLVVGLQAAPAVSKVLPTRSANTPQAQAKASGKKVLIAEKTTPTSQTWANPDGSYRTELNVAPVRAKVAGNWVPVDMTLHANGALVSPAAGATPLVFSGGGSAPLVRLGAPGQAFELHWPTALPTPVLSGDTATYPEVLPGADLVMRATTQGYSETMVVKNRQAATNPAIRNIHFTIVTDGLSLQAEKNGTLDAVDKTGTAIWSSVPPATWDSTQRTTANKAMASTTVAMKSPVSRAAIGTFALAGKSLTVAAPTAFLDDPNTVYPIAIDPDFSPPRVGWAEVYGYPSELTGQAYWNGDGDNIAKVGYSDWDQKNGVPSKHPVVMIRSYFQFDVGALVGADILEAEFNDRENYSPSCQARTVELHTTGQISGSTTWNNQPWDGGAITDGAHPSPNVAHGYSSSCPPEPVGFWAKRAITDGLGCGCHLATVMLRAGNEGDDIAWKKFDTNPSIVVTYNRHPNAPTALFEDVPLNPHLPCSQTVDVASSNATSGLRMHATVSDPDNDLVNALFEWFYWGGNTIANSGWTPMQASGSEFTATIPDNLLVDGAKLGYRVLAGDGKSTSDAWSASCEITIDRTKPAAPTIASDLYKGYDPATEDGTVTGGIGQTGQFTFTAGSDSDVAGFYYSSIESPTPVYVAMNASTRTAVLGITPSREGPFDLSVRTVDRAGNQSAVPATLHFFAGGGSTPIGYWRLDGKTGETTAPEWTGRHGGTLTGPATWATGRVGDALQLNGTSAYVATAGAAPIDTKKSFTISAWTKLDKIGGYPVVASIDSAHSPGFQLQATPDAHWALTMFGSDVDGGGTVDRVVSAAPAVTGTWTHLVGEYDAGRHQVRIYVNGVLSGTLAHTSTWSATGVFTIGRSMWTSQLSDYFPGAIDEVKLYDRMLSDADNNGDDGRAVFSEAHALAVGPASELGFWPLDDGTGTSATDASGNYRIGKLGSSVSWAAGTIGTGSAAFTSTPTGIDTGGPIVSGSQSFTISARVLTDSTAGNPVRNVASQDGPADSGAYSSDFALTYAGGSKTWAFSVVGAGTVTAAAPMNANEWTAVTAEYDAAAKQLRLYVNGQRRALLSNAGTATMAAAGPFVIGRGRAGTVTSGAWVGRIDDVHVYSGVLRDGAMQSDESVWPTDRFQNNEVLYNLNHPQTGASTPYGAQLGLYVGHAGERIATTGAIPAGYHLDSGLGYTVAPGTAGTTMLYSCRAGTNDYFVSIQATCEGTQYLGPIGPVFAAQPSGVASRPLYRCHASTGHMLSNVSGCGDPKWTSEGGPFGYALDRSALLAYVTATQPAEEFSNSGQVPGNFRPTGQLGVLGAVGETGTTALKSCVRGADHFLSLDAGCEGATVLGTAGSLWTAAPAKGTALYRCKNDTTSDIFESTDENCDGQQNTAAVQLGYLLTAPW